MTEPAPFGMELVPELPLAQSPLALVIAQVRFPQVASIVREDFVGPFQEAVRNRYPVLRAEREVNVLLTPHGPVQEPGGSTIWRFTDPQQTWEVSLGSAFLAVQTHRYSRRMEFLDRLTEALAALAAHVAPGTVDRLGIRYVNRLTGEALDDLSALVRPEVLGLAGAAADGATLIQSVGTSQYDLGRAGLLVRSGLLPPGATLDPGVEALNETTWVLDLDMFTTSPDSFDLDRLSHTASDFAASIYRYFRWCVTDELLDRSGAQR